MIEIRDESPRDVDTVRDVTRQAFGQDHEGRIVDALRQNDGILLSLVAEVDGAVVGHILFSPLRVGTMQGAALGPMAVAPGQQRRGIGSQLVERGLDRLRAKGCPFVVVIGHPDFYPRFGFEPARSYGLTCEWDVPADAFMVAILDPNVPPNLAGRVVYRSEFSTP